MRAYEAKLTGALADRIDISVVVEQPDLNSFSRAGRGVGRDPRPGAGGARARARRGIRGAANAELPAERGSRSAPRRERLLADVGLAIGLSGRGRERALRLARTLADLHGREQITIDDVEEALTLRRREG